MSEINEKDSMSLSLPVPAVSLNNINYSNSDLSSSHRSIKSGSRKSLKNKRRQSFMSGNSKIASNVQDIDDRFGGCLHSDSEDNDNARPRDDDSDEDNDEDNDSDVKELRIHNIRNKDDLLRTPLQQKFYYFFEEPSSKWAKAFEAFSIFCTIITIAYTCVASWPSIYPHESQIYEKYWTPVDSVALSIFTIEYLGRFYASVNKWKFFWKIANLIDLISIIPLYLQVINSSESFFHFVKVLRLLRLLKIIRVAKYTAGFNITTKVFQRSAYQIVMISIYILVILLASSALMFYIERGTFHMNDMTWYRTGVDGNIEVSPFQSIVHSFWWSIVTLTTTGYGDAVPVTAPGKLVAALTMTCGILVIALPTSIIGSNFNTEWSIHRRLRFQLKLNQKREQAKEILLDVRQSKSKKIEVLQSQNQAMLLALGEIQERLAEINPPRYYRKYKKLEIKHMEALQKIAELEDKLARLKRIFQNLDTFNNSRKDADSDSDVDGRNRSSGWKWRSIPFRNFSSASQKSDISRFISDVEAEDKSKRKMLISTLKTFGKSVSNLTSKKPIIAKEFISSPTELRHSFIPIVDPKKGGHVKSISDGYSNSRHICPIPHSEFVDSAKDKSINTDKNGNLDLSSDNIEDKIDTQDDQDNIIRKNDKKIDNSQSKQNKGIREIEIIVDNQQQ